MKQFKYLSLLILFIITGLRVTAVPVLAQDVFNTLFDTQHLVIEQKINVASTKVEEPVQLSPITTITVPKDGFAGDVTLYVYSANWDRVKTLIPSDESPISSYYLVFKDSNNKVVLPSSPITIQSYNNYANTNTFFYPVNSNGVDTANNKKWLSNVMVNTSLPISDQGFIIGANIILNPNDNSLHPKFIPTQAEAPANNPVVIQKNGNLQNALLPIIILLLVVVCAIFVIILLRNNKKQ